MPPPGNTKRLLTTISFSFHRSPETLGTGIETVPVLAHLVHCMGEPGPEQPKSSDLGVMIDVKLSAPRVW